MIKAHFSVRWSTPLSKRPRPAFDVPEKPGTRYTIVTDKEATSTALAISNLRPARTQDTVGGYRQIMMDQLFGDMLDARLDELDQRENPPFLRVAAGRGLFDTPRTKDEVVLQALVPNDGITRGLETMVTEINRVRRFGFTESELARAKQTRMLAYERGVTESPDRESSSRADEYTRNFLQNEALPTVWQELAFHRRFIPGITLAEINALTEQWFPDQNRLVIVTAPDAAGVALPDAGAARRRGQGRLGQAGRSLRGRRGRLEADGGTAGEGLDREGDAASGSGDHGVDAVERRHRRAQADHAERGPDPVPGHCAGRHLAGGRRRLRPGARRGLRRARDGRRGGSTDRRWTSCSPARP